MAGYRPKSLDELNNMYDKTLAAERAIRKGTSLVEKSSENAILGNITEDIEKIAEEVKQSIGLSGEIDDFIAKYSTEEPEEEKNEAKPKPQMTVLVPEQAKNEKPSFELSEDAAEAAAEETPRVDRSDLMDEYMRIMNDEEDDEVPPKKLSRKEKKKLKMMEKREAEKAAQQKEEAEDEAPAEEAEIITEEAPAEEPEEFYAPVREDTAPQSYDYSSPEEEFRAPEYVAVGAEADDASFKLEEDNDFDFPQDYTPAWMKDEKEEETVKPERKKVKKTEKKTSDNVFLKAILSLTLALLVFIGSTATVFKTLVPVNTGKAANDTFYFFTAYKDYTDLGLKKGDLIITENRYTQDGDIFAYIDYSNRSFEFGRRNDSITNDDGVVLLVTENQGSRTLVSRDDCKGVIYSVYPTVGTVISILSDNFIIIISVVAVSALVIILVLALALRNKDKAAGTKKAKVTMKAVKELPEEPEIEELEEVDLFTTI